MMLMLRLALAALALLLVLPACGGGGGDAPPAAPAAPPGDDTSGGGSDDDSGGGDGGLTAFAQAMLDAVNAERSSRGIAPLTWNADLEAAAQGHTQDMVDQGFLEHEGSDGSSPADRVTATGYVWSFVAENIASGHTSIEQVMQAWMNSAGHRSNILDTRATEFGAARIGNTWTQVFAAPLSGSG